MYGRGGFPIDHHATVLALGAAAENLVWAMRSLSMDSSSWFIGPPGEDGVFARGLVEGSWAIHVSDAEPLWKRRHTSRLPYYSSIAPKVAAELATCGEGSINVRMVTGNGIRRMAEWVRKASEVRFQTREVNEWFASSLRYGDSPADRASGLHVDTLALPPGGVGLLRLMSDWRRLQWLNRMRAFKFFAAIEAVNFQKAPLVVAITGPSGREAGFDAGRCMQRVWLNLTKLGLSAHPYYVVPDLLNRLDTKGVPEQCISQAEALRKEAVVEFGGQNTVHIMLRVGKPKGGIPVSGRLPLGQIMCSF